MPPTPPATEVDSVAVTEAPWVNSVATLPAICDTVRARSLLLLRRSDSDSDWLVAADDLLVQSITATLALSPGASGRLCSRCPLATAIGFQVWA